MPPLPRALGRRLAVTTLVGVRHDIALDVMSAQIPLASSTDIVPVKRPVSRGAVQWASLPEWDGGEPPGEDVCE